MKNSKRRAPGVLVAAVLALACGLFAITSSSAGAADACVMDDYGTSTVLATSAASAAAGSTVTVTGTGFPADCDITLQVAGTTIGTATTGPDGTFSFPWAIPAGQAVGTVTIDAVVDGQTLASTDLEVTAATSTPTTSVAPASSTTVPAGSNGTGQNGAGQNGTGQNGTGSGSLPATGAQIGVLVFGGLVMLAAGTALLMWNRGRRVSTQL